MTPEAAHYLERAREALSKAEKIASIELPRIAARSAYFAAFHAADALITQRTGKVAKTHSGVRSEFARLTRTLPEFDSTRVSFLTKTYTLKEISDYAVGNQPSLTAAAAEDAISSAKRFVARYRPCSMRAYLGLADRKP